ncbi:hypothetical protein J6590_068300 [Homalodisca vitripennis]|nr:hypothetical protein J6590_068300 [Homalodisca vitripennis]
MELDVRISQGILYRLKSLSKHMFDRLRTAASTSVVKQYVHHGAPEQKLSQRCLELTRPQWFGAESIYPTE